MPANIKKNIGLLGGEYFKTVTTMLVNAIGLVAALAWNTAIKTGIDKYISSGSGFLSELIYAVVITILLVIVTIQLGKIAQHFENKEK